MYINNCYDVFINILIADDIRGIKPQVEYIVQSIKDNIKDLLPHSVDFQLDCKGPGIFIWLYTSVNLENGIKFVSPLFEEINATIKISHFMPQKKGVYYCLANVSSYTEEKIVLINSSKYYSYNICNVSIMCTKYVSY